VLTSDLYLSALNFIYLKDYERAYRLLKEVESSDFGDVDIDVVYNAIGSVQINRKCYDDAVESLECAYSKNPTPEYAANLAQAYMFKLDPASALRVCESAIENFNDNGCEMLRLKAASACDMLGFYHRSKQYLKNELGMYLGMKLMQLGDYDNGTKLYSKRANEYARMIPGYDGMLFLQDFETATKSRFLSIVLEQGLGDCLMMLPYVLYLCRVRKVSVRLISLDGRHDAFLDDIASSYSDTEDLSCYKMTSALFSHMEKRPHQCVWMFDLLRGAPELYPKCLIVNPQIKDLASDLGDYVGICWRGNPSHQNDHWRSIDIEEFYPIIKSRKCIALQTDLSEREREFLKKNNVKVWDKKGLVSLSAIVSNLSAVVTVDTALSHLTGVIGAKCYTMVPVNSDWRWGVDPKGSRFYSKENHIIIRQRKIGQWAESVGSACEFIREKNNVQLF
jgi:tetratricopeptide (TPR) repeat protein